MKKIVTAAALLTLSAISANGADLAARPYTKAAPMMQIPAAYDWSGFYLGGQIGYAGSRSNYTLDNSVVVERFGFDPKSAIGGGHAGLQGQFGSWVLGVEGTYNAVGLKQTDVSVLLPGRLRTNSTTDIATVVGKVGYATGPVLLYAKGGWADAKIETSGINPATGISGNVNAWASGYTIGGGVDYMFAKNWIAGVDFNYYRFGFNRNTLATDGTPSNYTGRNEIYAGMFRLSYLFNWSGPLVARY